MPRSRIFSYGYNSVVAFTRSISDITDFANALLVALKAIRRKIPRRPLIFICHSLGGIVCKQALIIANERQNLYGDILNATKGILFMGTPHRGADVAFWSGILGTLANGLTLGQGVRTDLLGHLKTKSNILGAICTQFVERGAGLQVVTFFERKKIPGVPGLVCENQSRMQPIHAVHQ